MANMILEYVIKEYSGRMDVLLKDVLVSSVIRRELVELHDRRVQRDEWAGISGMEKEDKKELWEEAGKFAHTLDDKIDMAKIIYVITSELSI